MVDPFLVGDSSKIYFERNFLSLSFFVQYKIIFEKWRRKRESFEVKGKFQRDILEISVTLAETPYIGGTPGGENILLKTLLMAVIGLSAAKR